MDQEISLNIDENSSSQSTELDISEKNGDIPNKNDIIETAIEPNVDVEMKDTSENSKSDEKIVSDNSTDVPENVETTLTTPSSLPAGKNNCFYFHNKHTYFGVLI
jgi:hypothetical protein